VWAHVALSMLVVILLFALAFVSNDRQLFPVYFQHPHMAIETNKIA